MRVVYLSPPSICPLFFRNPPNDRTVGPVAFLLYFHCVSTLLELLHLGHHRRLVPFLARARDGAFVGDEFVELATDGGRVVVAGYFAFDFFDFDGAAVAFLGGRSAGGGVRVDVLLVGRAVVFVFRGAFGVGGCSVGGGAGAAGATGLLWAFWWLVSNWNKLQCSCFVKKIEEKVDVCCSYTRFRL